MYEQILHTGHGESLKSRILHLYGEETTRQLRLFEKLRIKKTKLLTSLTFLLRCRDHNTIPRFLQFHHHNPKENILHTGHGESLKSRMYEQIVIYTDMNYYCSENPIIFLQKSLLHLSLSA